MHYAHSPWSFKSSIFPESHVPLEHPKVRVCKLVKPVHKDNDKVPSQLLSFKFRFVKDAILPISDGKVPLKLFSGKDKSTRSDRLSKLAGKVPDMSEEKLNSIDVGVT